MESPIIYSSINRAFRTIGLGITKIITCDNPMRLYATWALLNENGFSIDSCINPDIDDREDNPIRFPIPHSLSQELKSPQHSELFKTIRETLHRSNDQNKHTCWINAFKIFKSNFILNTHSEVSSWDKLEEFPDININGQVYWEQLEFLKHFLPSLSDVDIHEVMVNDMNFLLSTEKRPASSQFKNITLRGSAVAIQYLMETKQIDPDNIEKATSFLKSMEEPITDLHTLFNPTTEERVILLSPYPIEANFDDEGLLHSSQGYALRYDGWGMHFIHGVYFNQYQMNEFVYNEVSNSEVNELENQNEHVYINEALRKLYGYKSGNLGYVVEQKYGK